MSKAPSQEEIAEMLTRAEQMVEHNKASEVDEAMDEAFGKHPSALARYAMELRVQLEGLRLQYTLVSAEHAGDHEALEGQGGVLKELQERFDLLEGWAQRYLDLSDISDEEYRKKYDAPSGFPIELDEDDISEGIRQVLHPEVT